MGAGPNDTLDMLDYPPATREELELSANQYAERAYKLGEENKRLCAAIDELEFALLYCWRKATLHQLHRGDPVLGLELIKQRVIEAGLLQT